MVVVNMLLVVLCIYLFTGEASIAASIVWTLHRPIASLLGDTIQDIQECRHNHYDYYVTGFVKNVLIGTTIEIHFMA